MRPFEGTFDFEMSSSTYSLAEGHDAILSHRDYVMPRYSEDAALNSAISKHTFVDWPRSHLELREAFDEFDGDEDDRVDRQEFAELVVYLEGAVDGDEAEVEFDELVGDPDATVAFSTFLAWWRRRY